MIKEIISFKERKTIIDMKQYSADWTVHIYAESSVGEPLEITTDFELLLVNDWGTFLITEDHYNISGGVLILNGNSDITQYSGINALYLKNDCLISYGAKMCVIDSELDCSDSLPLPEYDCSAELSGYGTDIQLDSDRTQSVTSKIDELDNYVDSLNESIITNSLGIIDLESRVTALEVQFETLPDFSEIITEEEDPIFSEWLDGFDFGQFLQKEATLLDDFENLTLEAGYYYTDEATLNDTPDGNISNAELIVSPNLRTWIGIDKWNGVFIRSYIVDTDSWNPWRQLLSTKDIEELEAQVADHETRITELEAGTGSSGSYPPNVYYSDVPEETLLISNVNSPLTIARFSPTENGVYEANLSCFVKRTDSANSDETIILYIYDGTTVRRSLVYNSGKDFDYCYSLTGYQFNRSNTGDVTIKVNYSGAAGAELETSGVVATIKKVSDL